jgi:hypothetical protein
VVMSLEQAFSIDDIPCYFFYERYTITLPDGFHIREMYDRCQEQSLLFLLQLNTSIEVEAIRWR